jgi:hypothetical protein
MSSSSLSLFFFGGGGGESCRLLDNVETHGRTRQATDDSMTQFMYRACWITKATHTHARALRICNTCFFSATKTHTHTHTCSEYVTLVSFPLQKHTHTCFEYVTLVSFPLQQCLCECASVLGYLYVVCCLNLGCSYCTQRKA